MPSRPLGVPPTRPHLACADGYWWHDDPKRTCVVGETQLHVDDVEQCFSGPALARAERIARLTRGNLRILFPEDCPCGANHRKLAANLARAYNAIRPSARKAAEKLGARDLIALGATRRKTDEETERAQVIRAAALSLSRAPRADEEPPLVSALAQGEVEVTAELGRLAVALAAAAAPPSARAEPEAHAPPTPPATASTSSSATRRARRRRRRVGVQRPLPGR